MTKLAIIVRFSALALLPIFSTSAQTNRPGSCANQPEFQLLPLGAIPVSINNKGEIAGRYTTDINTSTPFVRDAEGNITTFQVPGYPANSVNSVNVVGINDAGEIAGTIYSFSTTTSSYLGFFRDKRGVITVFDDNLIFGLIPVGIDSSGEIVGYSEVFSGGVSSGSGFLRTKHGKITYFNVPGSSSIVPKSFNDRGEVVGIYSKDNVLHNFIRTRDGEITSFDVGTPVNNPGIPSSINNSGQVIGYTSTSVLTFNSFLLDIGGHVTNFGPPDFVSSSPSKINDSGYIVGVGYPNVQNFLAHQSGFIRDPLGRFTVLTFPGVYNFNGPISINNRGDVIGNHEGQGFVCEAFSGSR